MKKPTSSPWSVVPGTKRLVIYPELCASIGRNIQGPSVIKVPDWIKNRLGKYYMYFADHKGVGIKLAYSDTPDKGWVYFGEVLKLENSLYPVSISHREEDLNRLVPSQDWPPAGTPGTHSIQLESVTTHIASPDVHVLADEKKIAMYFHGLESFAYQATRLAFSDDGIHFIPCPDLLGPSYFRVFEIRGTIYGLVMPGQIYQASSYRGPFVKVRDLFNCPRQRHSAVFVSDGVLRVIWSRVGDAPESLLQSTFQLCDDVQSWEAIDESILTQPEYEWEGADLPLERSWRSSVDCRVNQLRDPAILLVDGEIFLYYAVAGEAGIGVCRVA